MTYFFTFNIIISKILSKLQDNYVTNRIQYLSSNQLTTHDFPDIIDKISFLCIMLTKKYGINRELVCDKWLQVSVFFYDLNKHNIIYLFIRFLMKSMVMTEKIN